jgi:hypothetical protein
VPNGKSFSRIKIPFVKIFYFFHQDFGGENESFKLKVAGLKLSGLRLQRKVSVIKKTIYGGQGILIALSL